MKSNTVPDFEISTDSTRIDLTMVYDFLASSYWARADAVAPPLQSEADALHLLQDRMPEHFVNNYV